MSYNINLSESSSDNIVEYQNSKGENLLENKTFDKTKLTTDTDYYFGMIANPDKIIQINSESDSSSYHHSDKRSETSGKSSSSSRTSSSSSRRSNTKNTSESRPKYESVTLSPPKQKQIFVPPPIINKDNNMIKTEDNKPLTIQEVRMKKIEMLRKLCEIKAKGFQLSKEYDFNSSLEEMEYEYELLRSFADKRNGVKIAKSGLLQTISVIEFLNDKYDPFDFHLSGWGDHVSIEIDSWDDVLEELYEKYKGSGKKMAPEIKLFYLIIASASAFHFTKSQASKLPGLDSLLASNPGLLSKVLNPAKETSQFMTPQELNIEKQREELKKHDQEMKQKLQQQSDNQQNYIQQLQQQINKQNEMLNQQKQYGAVLNPETFNSGYPQAANSKVPVIPPPIPASQLKSVLPNIKAPDQVKEILNRIHNIQSTNTKPMTADTQDETTSQNDRLLEDSTLSESTKRKAGRKPKKANISIF